MGTDDFRRDYGVGLLQRRSSRAVSGALYHGERIHWIRDCPHYPPYSRTVLAAPYGTKSGVLRQLTDCGVGMRKHVYGASMGWAMG